MKPSTKIDRICIQCGIEFRIFKCWIRTSNRGGIFCSTECRRKGRFHRPPVMIEYICAECGIFFKRRNGYNGTHTYCSNSCRATACGRRNGGENHPNWKGGISERTHSTRMAIKRAVRERGKCERCGSTENLQGHHIERYSVAVDRRSDPSNIEVLCANCHAKEHPNVANMLLYPRIRSGAWKSCLVCDTKYYRPRYSAEKSKFCSYKCCYASRKGRKMSWLNKTGSNQQSGKIQEVSTAA